jgi:hypothetical protein
MRQIAVLLIMLFGASLAFAQRSNGYWYAAPGGATSDGNTGATIHLGGGVEIALPKGFGAGVEGGAVGSTQNYTDSVLGVVSINGYYHFRQSRSIRTDPFVTGGYSLFFRRGTANLGNFGGGVNYWFTPTLAFRAEFRDHAHVDGIHFWGFRLGLSFSELWP